MQVDEVCRASTNVRGVSRLDVVAPWPPSNWHPLIPVLYPSPWITVDVSVGGGVAQLHATSVGRRGFLPYSSSKGDAPVEVCFATR